MGDGSHSTEAPGHGDPVPPTARVIHGVVTAVTGVGLGTSLWIGWHNPTHLPSGTSFQGGLSAGWEHMLNQPVHFTFFSALMVFGTSLALTLRPHAGCGRRWGTAFQTLRLSGVVCMMLSGFLWNLLLREPELLSGLKLLNDSLYHLVLPVLVPLVWLMAGPHGRITGTVVLLSPIPPALWFLATLLRGPGLDWYPYSILDVPQLGYPAVFGLAGGVLAAFLVMAWVIWKVDRMMDRYVGRLEIGPSEPRRPS